jgi:16S rRNA (cytidine1402-2'-O)-methyltransferase
MESGVPVTVVPGPSAVETALVASGFAVDRYQFLGYLPRGERALAAMWDELAIWPHAVVAFESPRRLPATLRSLAGTLPERELAVCRELTKRFEEVVRGPARVIASRYAEAPRGEITLVLAPGGVAVEREPAEAVAAVEWLLARGIGRRDAAEVVSRLTGVPRNRLYRTSL